MEHGLGINDCCVNFDEVFDLLKYLDSAMVRTNLIRK